MPSVPRLRTAPHRAQVKRDSPRPAGLTLERCDRMSVTGVSVLDCDGIGVWLKDVTRSRVTGCLIRDDRPGATSLSMRAAGGRENLIADNVLGRPHEILRGVGVVERNYEPWKK